MPGYPSWSAPIAPAIPSVGEHTREDQHRVLDARVLGVRLDPVEGGLRPHALDLELRHEHDQLAIPALCATITGRSVERNQKPVRYWIDCCPNST